MRVDPCECVKRQLRAVVDGFAHCPRHRLYATKIAGSITADTSPPGDSMRPLSTRQVENQREMLRQGARTTKRQRVMADAQRRR